MKSALFYLICFQLSAARPQAGARILCRRKGGIAQKQAGHGFRGCKLGANSAPSFSGDVKRTVDIE
jgi:hypothetical protein